MNTFKKYLCLTPRKVNEREGQGDSKPKCLQESMKLNFNFQRDRGQVLKSNKGGEYVRINFLQQYTMQNTNK